MKATAMTGMLKHLAIELEGQQLRNEIDFFGLNFSSLCSHLGMDDVSNLGKVLAWLLYRGW